jgi:hypothetical protein
MVKYRILERRVNGDWPPFGVAYEREGGVFLFAPPWRADRKLPVASLEELAERDCPSPEFRWRAVETTTESITHPIEVLQRALETQSVATWAELELTASTPEGEVPVKILVGKGIAERAERRRKVAVTAHGPGRSRDAAGCAESAGSLCPGSQAARLAPSDR